MSDNLPNYLVQGEVARLFPVLSTTSKEGRTTSIVLACLAKIDEFGASVLDCLGQKVGARSKVETYTEVVPKVQPAGSKERPDGLIVIKKGKNEWKALVETKVGNNNLEIDQIERYRTLCKDNKIDCVVTISNQFSTTPYIHPLDEVRKSRSKIPVFHFSWMSLLTQAELLINQEAVADNDQKILLNELRRFLSHESAGVKGFDRMPKEWSDINKLISSGGVISAKSEAAVTIINAWHQETRDLSLILSRMTETHVCEKLTRKHSNDRSMRLKDELIKLREEKSLSVQLEVENAASPLDVLVDMNRRCIDVSMMLRAPEDKVSTKARVNWILKQVKGKNIDDLYLRLLWPGKNEPTQFLIRDLIETPDIAHNDRNHLAPHSFQIFQSKHLAGRFIQQANFISDLEDVVPAFYRNIGSDLSAWVKKAAKIKKDKALASDVSTTAIFEESEEFHS